MDAVIFSRNFRFAVEQKRRTQLNPTPPICKIVANVYANITRARRWSETMRVAFSLRRPEISSMSKLTMQTIREKIDECNVIILPATDDIHADTS